MKMSDFEEEHNKLEMARFEGNPTKIEIAAIKTREAYKEEYRKHGLVPTSRSDYPRGEVGYRQIERLLEFDRLAKKDIKKIIRHMTIQPVTVEGKRKYALYFGGDYMGYDAMDSRLNCEFNEGFYFKPKLYSTVVNTGRTDKDIDPETAERRKTWTVEGYTYEHYIFVPENPKERTKFLQELVNKSLGTVIENCIFSFRQPNYENNHSSPHDNISWYNFCNLDFKQLSELQNKGYYKEGSTLKDKSGYSVKYDHDRMQAIR